jgi:hypothetical protein
LYSDIFVLAIVAIFEAIGWEEGSAAVVEGVKLGADTRGTTMSLCPAVKTKDASYDTNPLPADPCG